MASQLERVARRIVDYPEETVPVVSSRDWISDKLRSPGIKVNAHYASLVDSASADGRNT